MSDRRQHIYATLRYTDAPAAIEWLQATLGFTEHEIHTNDDGTIAHAQLAFGEDLIMLGSGTTSGTQTIYLARPDVDEHFAAALEAGADVTMPITDQDYGSREYAIRDPEGNTWAVGTYQPSAG
jgi:uncharacterized glyoxalase superfamily protein PhnB